MWFIAPGHLLPLLYHPVLMLMCHCRHCWWWRRISMGTLIGLQLFNPLCNKLLYIELCLGGGLEISTVQFWGPSLSPGTFWQLSMSKKGDKKDIQTSQTCQQRLISNQEYLTSWAVTIPPHTHTHTHVTSIHIHNVHWQRHTNKLDGGNVKIYWKKKYREESKKKKQPRIYSKKNPGHSETHGPV